MHLLSVLVHKVTHIQAILQVVVVLFLMIHHDLAYQLVRLFLVLFCEFNFSGRWKNCSIEVDLLGIKQKVVLSHGHSMQVHCAAPFGIKSHVKCVLDSHQTCL